MHDQHGITRAYCSLSFLSNSRDLIVYAADEFFNFGNILKLFSVYTCIRQSLVYEASDHTVLIYRASKALVFFRC